MQRTKTVTWAGRTAVAGGLVLALGATGNLDVPAGATGSPDAPAAGSQKSASAQSADNSRAERPRMWLPFPCGQKWRVNSYDAQHAPSLDMVREPQSQTEGSRLQAAAPGKVRFTLTDPGAGKVVQIKHANGYYTTYLHLKKITVRKGDTVKRTTKIGTVGRTGDNSNGVPHLHFEVAKGEGNADQWGDDNGFQNRDAAWLYPKKYKEVGGNWRNQVSHSCSRPKPTSYAKYRVVKPVNKREWAGAKYKSAGKLATGMVISLGCNHSTTPDGKLWRRLKGSGGADSKGLWVRASSTYVKKIGSCS
ncbi:M23 family metallopeptidase [Streptomyces sp. T-3]|nr:M23 family metallopeptidase [Streptomyces sp. T-3]